MGKNCGRPPNIAEIAEITEKLRAAIPPPPWLTFVGARLMEPWHKCDNKQPQTGFFLPTPSRGGGIYPNTSGSQSACLPPGVGILTHPDRNFTHPHTKHPKKFSGASPGGRHFWPKPGKTVPGHPGTPSLTLPGLNFC